MKPNELIKILDSGVVKELKIYFCGGHITIEKDSCPFELPNYPIAKIWQSENGRGLSVLLEDNTKKEEKAAESANAETAEKAADTLRKYCDGFNVCSKSCVFYNKDNFGCRVNFPTDYEKGDGDKS